MTDEGSRLKHFSSFVGAHYKQGFQAYLNEYGFESLKPYFVGTRCLELGPADGQLTGRLFDIFQDVTCVDGTPSFCEKLRDTFAGHPGFHVECALFEEYRPTSVFDTIVATHIWEHLEDPVLIFRRVKKWLSQNGVFIVLVPNALSFHRLVAVKMGVLKTPHQLNDLDIRLGHRRVYTIELLVDHLTRGGWAVQTTGGVYFKVLTNVQIESWFSKEMMDGFYELGKDFPEYAAEIYAVCRLPQS